MIDMSNDVTKGKGTIFQLLEGFFAVKEKLPVGKALKYEYYEIKLI